MVVAVWPASRASRRLRRRAPSGPLDPVQTAPFSLTVGVAGRLFVLPAKVVGDQPLSRTETLGKHSARRGTTVTAKRAVGRGSMGPKGPCAARLALDARPTAPTIDREAGSAGLLGSPSFQPQPPLNAGANSGGDQPPTATSLVVCRLRAQRRRVSK